MCPNCRAFITNKDRVCPYCNERVGPRAIDLRSPADFLGGMIPHARATTTIFLLINVAFYLASMAYPTLVEFGAKLPWRYLSAEWWRLVTAGFFHGGLMHIAMNGWVLFDLGPQVEENFGTSRYVVLFLLCVIIRQPFSGSFSGAVRLDRSDDRPGRAQPDFNGRGHPRHVHPLGDLRPVIRVIALFPHRQLCPSRRSRHRLWSGVYRWHAETYEHCKRAVLALGVVGDGGGERILLPENVFGFFPRAALR
jgi:hypothetical protein